MDELLDRLDALAAGATPAPPAFLRAVRRRRFARRLTSAAAAAVLLAAASAVVFSLRSDPVPKPTGGGSVTAQNPAPTPTASVAPTFALLRRLNVDSDRLILPPAPPGGSSPEQVLTFGRSLDPAVLRDWLGDS